MTLPKPLVVLLVWCFVLTNVPLIPAGPFIVFHYQRSAQTNETDQVGEGLTFRLSEVTDQPIERPTEKVVTAEPLSLSETNRILDRLPAISEEAREEIFKLREGSMRPPRSGKTINISFPAGEQISPNQTAPDRPLEVLRFSPEGPVPVAASLTITFSQPMVALSSQEEVAAHVPVKLTPAVDGKWRWLSPSTLVFEPQGRFPMATDYTVLVPQGLKSAIGGALRQQQSWRFTTPAPTIKTSNLTGSDVQRRDKIIFIEFDQRIHPAEVLKKIKVHQGSTVLVTRLATAAEIEADEEVGALVTVAGKDRWIALRAVNAETNETSFALPPAASISVSVEAGTPSAEGPRTTSARQRLSFSTFGPMRLTNHFCGYHPAQVCTPDNPFTLTFSNPIDGQQFEKREIKIDPAIPNANLYHHDGTVRIEGIKSPNTTYTVTINSLRDVFGQNIERPSSALFTTGPAVPWFHLAAKELTVLDPAGPRSVRLYTIGVQKLQVELYSVRPEDWMKFAEFKKWSLNKSGIEEPGAPERPGHLISSRQLNFTSSDSTMVETEIDLGPALKNKLGQVIVYVNQISAEPSLTPRWFEMVWVQSTRIGLDAFVDHEEMIGWATSLTTGAPLSNVQMRLLSSNHQVATGVDGLSRLALPPETKSHEGLLVATLNDDLAILPEMVNWWNWQSTWRLAPRNDSLVWYVFDDRGLYRPGERVHIKGWVRRIGSSQAGDLGSLNGGARSVDYVLEDARDIEIAKGTLELNTFGGFDTSIELPSTMNLGETSLEFELKGGDPHLNERDFTHAFEVQEFRRPEFEVNARAATNGPFFVGNYADVVVAANYFAGGALPGAGVTWNVASAPAKFTPPNRDDFSFGKWSSWWGDSDSSEGANYRELEGKTNPSGNHRLRINFDSAKPAYASSVVAEASVTDVNRQTWTSSVTLLVHPADSYVGLRSKKLFVQQGEPLVVESIVTDLEGKAVAGRDVSMRATLLEWKQIGGAWQEVESNSQDCKRRSTLEVVQCSFSSKDGGAYRIVATTTDDQGRRNDSELRLWVAGGKKLRTDVEGEEVELIPQAKDYKPGDVAELLVRSPFYPVEGLMTLRRSGMVKSERFRMDGPTYTLRVPIVEEWTPNVHLQVDLVGLQDREMPEKKANKPAGNAAIPKQPAFASGEINLSIPPVNRRLTVAATPRDNTLQPGGSTTVDLEVKDAAGQSMSGAEVAVAIVDEAVLAMTNYKLRDPLSIFYAERGAHVTDYHSRENLVLAGEVLEGGGGAGGGAGSATETVTVLGERSITNNMVLDGVSVVTKSGTDKPKISLRKNFNALAVFAPSVRTNSSGRARVDVKLPDNLTRYRIMAVAVDATKRFGMGESAITARSPLMVRPSAPRFLNFGDRFELPVVIQNQTDRAMTVDMAVRATNVVFSTTSGDTQFEQASTPSNQAAIKPAATAGRRVIVPPNNRVELRIPAVVRHAGVAHFQVAASSGNSTDAAEISLPVWTPATTEAFAAYGEIDGEGTISQPVQAPKNVFVDFGGLDVQTSSTQLQELTDAFLYLQNYPFECSEQIASRILSVAALRDVLSAFKTSEMPSPEEIEAAVGRDLKRLEGMQNEDGGFSFWTRNERSWPFLSLHVAHALARAKEKKFAVPDEMLKKSRDYLRDIEKHIPKEYGEDARRALLAYALYVRMHMNDPDTAAARKLIGNAGLENLSLESVGWLLYVLSGDSTSQTEVEAIRKLLRNRATETAAAAHFVSSYKDGDYLLLHSNRRGDGIILEALIKDQPDNDLIPKIVRGLLAHRTKGRWENTQENAFILLALDRYFETYEKAIPDFIARVWLGDSYAGEQLFKGRSTDRRQISIPMTELAKRNLQQELIVDKRGAGRLYYRLGMRYAPSNLSLKPADYGFIVQRSYEAVDSTEDLKQDADGTWRIKAGARIRVRVKMIAPTRRYHVALVDPLPAGFETLNPELAVTGKLPNRVEQAIAQLTSGSDGDESWRWRSSWFDHQNFRDERAEAFTALLWDGVYSYTYVVRATTPGLFIVPPAKAEEMYHPETFGRGKTDRVRIE